MLKHPESLNQAYQRLNKLNEVTLQKLARLIKLEQQPLNDSEIPELIDSIEQMLAESSEQTVADRLKNTLTLNQAAAEIAGFRRMLARHRVLLPALEKIKDRGFQVAIRDQRRQPQQRPGLEAYRKESVKQKRRNGAANGLTTDSLRQISYHLTLWAYLIARINSC